LNFRALIRSLTLATSRNQLARPAAGIPGILTRIANPSPETARQNPAKTSPSAWYDVSVDS
jgi:hypothetical protein